MGEEVQGAASEQLAPDPKQEKATAIYAEWRNLHMNQIPVEMFNRLEAASKHLIEKIAAAL